MAEGITGTGEEQTLIRKIEGSKRQEQEALHAQSGLLIIPSDEDSSERTIGVLKAINDTKGKEPVICLTGETHEPLLYEGRDVDVHDILTENALKSGSFSQVLHYNAGKARLSFADDASGEAFGDLQIEINNAGENVVPALIDQNQMQTLQNTDRVVLTLIEKLIERLAEEEQKGCCVIIDRAEMLFSNGTASASAEKVHNEALLGDLKRVLKDYPGNRILLIDRRGDVSKNENLRKEILIQSLPLLTRRDVARVISEEGINPSNDVIKLADGIPVEELRSILRDTNDNRIVQVLKEAKERAIESGSGGLVRCKLDPLEKDQIHMSEDEWKMWETIVKQIHKNPDLVQDLLIMGPPGTGKSARAEALANILDIPFLEANDISSSGLRGRKEDKVRVIIETAKRNKPCVLFWDEIDKAIPRTEGNTGLGGASDNDDAEVSAYLQKELGSKGMEGVIVLGACNDPQQMNEALVRSGRFGKKIAVLPPESLEDKRAVFKAVKNQIKSLRSIDFSETFIDQVIGMIKEKDITGADFKFLLAEGKSLLDGEAFETLEEAILHAASTLRFDKNDRYHEFIDIAKKMHNATFIPWKQGEESVISEEVTNLAQWESSLRKKAASLDGLKQTEQILDEKVRKASQELLKLQELLESEQSQVNEIKEEKQVLLRSIELEIEKAKSESEANKKRILKEKEELEKELARLQNEEEESTDRAEKLGEVISGLEEKSKIALNANARSLSLEGQKLQESLLEQGAIVLEIKEPEEIIEFVRSNVSEETFDKQSLEDHGEKLEQLLPQRDLEVGRFVIFPQGHNGTFNKKLKHQQKAIKSAKLQLGKEKHSAIIPSIWLLIYATLIAKNSLVAKAIAEEGKEPRFRSSSRVPNNYHYSSEGLGIAGEFYEVGIQHEPGDDDILPSTIIDINSDDPNNVCTVDDDPEEGGNTSLLQVYRIGDVT